VAGPAAVDPDATREVLAAIDIGTNSVHMVVAKVSDGDRFEVLTRQKEMIRLGSVDPKHLADDAIERGIDALVRCHRIAEAAGAEVRAVATAAVRDAENRQTFLHRARREAGIDVEVVSGYEEARLIHLGVLQSLPVFDRRIVMVDIGGGSTELLVGDGDDVRLARSISLGAINITHRCFADGDWRPKRVDSCRRFVRDLLSNSARKIAKHHPDLLIGSSGTVETIVAMGHMADGAELPRTLNGATVTREQVVASLEALVAAGSAEAALDLPGVDPKRADILLGGAVILDEVMRAVGLDELTFSEGALREGILFDELDRRRGQRIRHHLSDTRRQGVLQLMELCEEDPRHARQTAWLAGRILAGVGGQLALHEDDAAELLEAAALLANVGLFISHSRHHQHSYYVIRNAECLTGFTDREIELIAQIARYHRRAAPNPERHEPFGLLDEADQQTVRSLAGVLRVAIGLDRSRDGVVETVDTDAAADRVTLHVGGRDAGVDVALEVWSANQRSALLAEVLGRPVEVRAVDGSTA